MKRFAALLLGLLLLVPPVFADDHVLVLLDTSGSMAESMRNVWTTKMTAAQQALNKVVDQMPATTQMGLLTFDGWVFHVGHLDKYTAQRAISNTEPNGGTPLGEYMKMGADELLSIREKNHGVGTYTLLVVTDGEATDGDLMDKYTPDIVARGLTLKTIGVNLGQAHTLAKRSVAYYPADDPQSLEGALRQVMAEVPAGNDDVAEYAYALIAGIPSVIIPKLLEAITSTITFNQPIGEKPKVKVVDEHGNVSFVTDEPPQEATGIGTGAMLIIGVVLAFAVVAAILVWVLGS